MASSSTPVLPSAAIAFWRRLARRAPLVVLGIFLLGAGMRELVSPALPAGGAASHPKAREAARPLVMPSPPATVGMPAWRGSWGRTGATVRVGRAAIVHPAGYTTAPEPAPIDLTAVDPGQAEGIDRFAAAMFGPPDRQPPPTLVGGALRRGQGEARGYLEWTVAARWMEPSYRAILARHEAGGHTATSSLDCVRGAEYQETPSCTAEFDLALCQ